MENRSFQVAPIDYATGLAELRTVRETVFVQEQRVPLEEEWDALDPLCRHVIARDEHGQPIGTGRLTPEHKIGRMAVLAEWRGQGVGDAMLVALLEEARNQGWPLVSLNAQVSAEAFY
ncbi:MAG: GNAT family N-acetyltransferase, partial [Pseudoxanthomonas sp.]